MVDVINLLSEIQIIETGKSQIRNDSLMKLMSTPVLYRSVTVTGVYEGVRHISCVTSDRAWISDWYDNFILTNTKGDTLDSIYDGNGAHTVTITGELIYIDKKYNIKLYKNDRTKSALIKQIEPWYPWCVYCSPFNGDLLVGMYRNDPVEPAKAARYSNTGQHIQTIQHDNTGQTLYRSPGDITENHNGDVNVSDSGRDAILVTDRGGRHRFSYTGPSGAELYPTGICTDVLSHILVCDAFSHTVQMIDKDGKFLSLFLTPQHGIGAPWVLSYDNKTQLL
ncbi:uncharacterized protein LOC133194314 [Saccostrea echinata]|uniref:uncharacterized protein LOC133194314 n=1 Tax=Saccostrea echinata TaxID=191078 RepID=UPI002A7FAE2D|nr:uncharacterized protein LOC133194314 [Saccostrea echinata]